MGGKIYAASLAGLAGAGPGAGPLSGGIFMSRPDAKDLRIGPRILVVDDDHTACDMLREALAGQDYDLRTALSGEEALELGRQVSFDVVITDLKMKEVDGIDVVRAFQQR